LAAAVFWFTTAITLSHVIGDRKADLVMAWGFPTADTQADLANDALLRPRSTARDRRRAGELAREALLREPVNAAAARALGLVAVFEGDQPRAARAFHYAESLSRRDLPTQLWLIEESVARDDVPAALRHYDRVLSVSRRSQDTLIPILVQAAAHPHIAAPLARLLSTRPIWWDAFTEKLISDGRAPRSILLVVRRLRLDPRIDRERALLAGALAQLFVSGNFDAADRLYHDTAGVPSARTELLRDGEFEAGRGFGPFEWWLLDDPDLAAVRQPREDSDGDFALTIPPNPSGRGGEVARQALLLAPGRYRLRFRAGGISGDELSRPRVVIRCATREAVELGAIRLPAIPRQGIAAETVFTVPRSCPAQWLAIQVGAATETAGELAWLDSFRLEPL
jgi:hypothetical protein